jgi:hypothetical protein
MFGNDALKCPLSTGFEQGSTVTIKLFAKLNAAISIMSDQVLQHGSTLRKRFLSEVFAVEMQQVEGVEDDAMRSDSHSRLERVKVRGSLFVLDDGFTINGC